MRSPVPDKKAGQWLEPVFLILGMRVKGEIGSLYLLAKQPSRVPEPQPGSVRDPLSDNKDGEQL